MRRFWWVAAVLVLGLGGVLIGCPAFHDDYPGTSCKTDSDCYQNEYCSTGLVCTPIAPPDLTIPLHFSFDFAMQTDMAFCDTDLGCPDLAGGGDM